jgi:hypothetical protein
MSNHEIRLAQLGEQGAGVSDIARGLATLDRGEDRLQKRTGIMFRGRVAP